MKDEWILVGVDGSAGSDAAVRYAATEASRTGMSVRLLHVAPELAYRVALDGEEPTSGDPRETLLVDAAATVRDVLGEDADDRVVTEVAYGGRVRALLEASRGCRLVVLGDQPRPRLHRLVTGSVLPGVAARSFVPVVVVPEGAETAGDRRRIVAAVKSADDWVELLDRVMRLAADRGARLVLLHAWHVSVFADDP